jgi:hypothetical protein
MSKNRQLASLLLEQFKQNWSYILHIEETRFKHTQFYLIITTAVIGIYYFLIQMPTENIVDRTSEDLLIYVLTRYGLSISLGSLFIFVYGLILCIFLVYQKRGYDVYRLDNFNIQQWFNKNNVDLTSFDFGNSMDEPRRIRDFFFSSFYFWYLLTVVVDAFSFGIFVVTLISSFISLNLFLIICLFTLSLMVIIFCESLIYYKIVKVRIRPHV